MTSVCQPPRCGVTECAVTSVCQALHDDVTKCVCDVSKPASDGGVSDVIIITLPSTLGFVCVCVTSTLRWDCLNQNI